MISDELAAQLRGKDRPTGSCPDCHTVSWWQRPPKHGGGWVCGVCHPEPHTIKTTERSTQA